MSNNPETPMQASEFEGHTPGEWHVRKMQVHFAIEAAYGLRVADVGYVGRPDGSTSEANARLIAAAPRLLRERDEARAERDELVAIVQMLVRFANDPKTFAVYKEGNIYDREQCVQDTMSLLRRLNKQGGAQ